ncbi:histidine kinase dimerization/phospho-acceptor domain-containing protein, partial [Arthrospira platensis SPKY2]
MALKTRNLGIANRKLEVQARELSASNEELEQYAYVASHDLQEPLRTISTFLQQLERNYSDQLDDRAKQYIHFAREGAQRMRQTILDLLELSKAGKLDPEFVET